MTTWNERTIRCPPTITKLQKLSNLDIPNIRETLTELQNTIKKNTFNKAAALLSRFIARRTASFHNQLGFKEMRKVNIAVCRLREIDLLETITNLHSTLPEIIIPGKKCNLPTRELFEYFLLRLISIWKLCERIIMCSRTTFILFLKYLHHGMFLELTICILSIMAQIWTYSKRVYETTIRIYNKLYQIRTSFVYNNKTSTTVNYYSLLTNLENIYENDQQTNDQLKPVRDDLENERTNYKRKFVEIQSDTFDKHINDHDSIMETKSKHYRTMNKQPHLNDSVGPPIKVEELGTVISRDAFIMVTHKKRKNTKKN